MYELPVEQMRLIPMGLSERQKTFLPELLEVGGVYLFITSHYLQVVSYFGVLFPRITGLSPCGAEFALAMLEHCWVKSHVYAMAGIQGRRSDMQIQMGLETTNNKQC